MATIKQKKAAENLVENGGNVSKAMRDAGYSEATAKTPQKLTESVGFLELCDELGLTDTLIAQSLVDDIKAKPGERKPELELAAKIRGLLKDKVEHSGAFDPVRILLDKYGITEGEGNDRQVDAPVQGSSNE